MKKIVLTGGGTAGHVYPALALIPYLKEYEFHFIGSDGMEKDILKNFPNIKYHQISAVKFARKFTLKNLLIPFKLISSTKQANAILKKIKPNIVFSKGGFVSVPVVIAARKQKIFCISHESDLSMGLANKINLKFCNIMCTTFPETAKKSKKCIFTGQPLRKELFQNTQSKTKNDFATTKPIILVVGGSSGAKFINEKIIQSLPILEKKFNIIHLTGNQNIKQIKTPSYIQIAYSNNIQELYSICNIAISRAGAGVISELLALKKPMLLIPLSKKCSRGDQIENAKLFQQKGFAKVIQEEQFTTKKLADMLDYLINNENDIISNMKTESNTACQQIAQLIKSKT